MTKKVLIFSLAYLPFVGGAELAIKEITDRISEIQFDLITLRFDSKLPRFEKLGNVNVYRIGFTLQQVQGRHKKSPTMVDLIKWPLKLNKLLFPFIAYFKAVRLHRKNHYDVIWAIMAAYAGFSALFFKLTHPKIPYLLTLQEGDPFEYIKKKVRFIQPLFKLIFTKANFIQVISTYLGNWARQMGYIGPLEVVPNGVDLEKFSIFNFQFSIKELKEKLNIKPNERILITTSRLVKKNAIDDVIESLKYLSEDIKFLILGTGPDKENLKFKIKNLKLEARVFLLGEIDPQEVPKYLAVSDIFIRPSLSEGLGTAFLEAMAAGIPVIATQVGGIADFLFDEERNPEKVPTGWAVEPRNPRGIANQVKNILANQEKTAQIIANAKKLVSEKYDWDKIALQMKEIFLNKLYGAN